MARFHVGIEDLKLAARDHPTEPFLALDEAMVWRDEARTLAFRLPSTSVHLGVGDETPAPPAGRSP